MATSLSESSQTIRVDHGRVAALNLALAWLVAEERPFLLDGVSLQLRQIHLGPGLFQVGTGSNRHAHDELQIEYGLSGHFQFLDDDRQQGLHAGGALLMLPGEPHAWQCLQTGAMLGVLLAVDGPRATELLTAIRQQGGRHMRTVSTPRQADMLADFMTALQDDTPGHWPREQAAAACRRLISYSLGQAYPLERWYPRGPEATQTNSRAELVCSRAEDFIRANAGRPIALADIALHAGVSSRHLSRLFRAGRGLSVNDYLLRQRLSRAHDLLAGGEYPVKAVAYACGFASPSYFTTCYRRHFGRLPSTDLGRAD